MRANFRTCFVLAAVTALVTGCGGGSMTLDTPTFPAPLVDKIPVSVGLRLSPDMYRFAHEEQVFGKETWSVNFGDANATLFRQLFGHMFTDVTELQAEDDPYQLPIDALVETSIDAFEFSVPEQTSSNSFAVWIRYRLKVYDKRGDMIANWPVSAYGRSETEILGATEALERAALLAMRDAAALMIMKLDAETGISSLAQIAEPPADDASDNVEDVAVTIDADNTSSFAAGGIQDAI